MFKKKIVYAGRSSPVGLTEVEPRMREVDRDPESAERVASPEELDESLMVEEEKKLIIRARFIFHSAWRRLRGGRRNTLNRCTISKVF